MAKKSPTFFGSLTERVEELEVRQDVADAKLESAYNDIALLKGENLRLAENMKGHDLVARVKALEIIFRPKNASVDRIDVEAP